MNKKRYAYSFTPDGLVPDGLWLTDRRVKNLIEIEANAKPATKSTLKRFVRAVKSHKAKWRQMWGYLYEFEFPAKGD